jgi:predicted nucleic acid-binding protein
VILVDTSVWVDAFRNPEAAVAATLKKLIDLDEVCLPLPVRLELAAGFSKADRAAFRRNVAALPVAVPTEDTWGLMERWVDQAADTGDRFTLTDLMIAALAHELTALVWSLDSDFERMASLGFIENYN